LGDGGKGSVPRPVDKKTFDENWDVIFKETKDEQAVPESDKVPERQRGNHKL